MASFRAATLAIVGGVIGTLAVGGGFLAGCGDDSGGDGGVPEAGMDSTMDVVETPDTGHDTAVADAKDSGVDAKDADATTIDADAADAADAPHDGDAAVDSATAHDGDAAMSDGDAARDGDTGVVDSGADVSDANPILAYAQQYAMAFCTGQGKCCPGYPGAFDINRCVENEMTEGWEFTLPASTAAYSAGHLTLNSAKATSCITALQGFACTVDDAGSGGGAPVTAAEYGSVTTACQGVLSGTLANGATGCVSSFECADGFCSQPTDGGARTCTPLVVDGGGCAAGSDTFDEMCSQAGQATPLWCDLLDFTDGGAICVPPFADNATCFRGSYFDNSGCTSLLCGDNGCGTTTAWPLPQFCQNFPTDSGAD